MKFLLIKRIQSRYRVCFVYFSAYLFIFARTKTEIAFVATNMLNIVLNRFHDISSIWDRNRKSGVEASLQRTCSEINTLCRDL